MQPTDHASPDSSHESALRCALIAKLVQLDAAGLNRGTSGNLSVRCGESVLITPSGIPPQELSADQMVLLGPSGVRRSPGTPSSEWRMHCDILATREDIHAVVHTHSTFSTTMATLQRDIPAFHYMIAAAGGDSIRCTPYALFGTQALSSVALEGLKDRKACLLGNHGLLAIGRDLAEAAAIAIEVEALCEQYWRALQIGPPALLSTAQMQEVIEKFRTYGKWKSVTPDDGL